MAGRAAGVIVLIAVCAFTLFMQALNITLAVRGRGFVGRLKFLNWLPIKPASFRVATVTEFVRLSGAECSSWQDIDLSKANACVLSKDGRQLLLQHGGGLAVGGPRLDALQPILLAQIKPKEQSEIDKVYYEHESGCRGSGDCGSSWVWFSTVSRSGSSSRC